MSFRLRNPPGPEVPFGLVQATVDPAQGNRPGPGVRFDLAQATVGPAQGKQLESEVPFGPAQANQPEFEATFGLQPVLGVVTAQAPGICRYPWINPPF